MRVLYFPHISAIRNMYTCSTMGWAEAFFKIWFAADPMLFLHIFVPRESLEKEPEYFERWKFTNRVEFIPVETPNDQYAEQMYMQPEEVRKFRCNVGTKFFDIAIVDKPGIIPMFQALVEPFTDDFNKKLLISSIHFLLDSEYRGSVDVPLEQAQCVGVGASDMILTPGTGEFDFLIDVAKRSFQPCFVKALLEKGYHVRSHIDMTVAEETSKMERKPHDLFTVHYPHAVTNGYYFGEIARTLKLFYRIGNKFRFLITSASRSPGMQFNEVRYESWIEPYFALSRREFYEKALTSDCFVYWVGRAGISSCVFEMQLHGVCGLFKKGVIPEGYLIPDWPFEFDNEIELLALLKFMKKNVRSSEVQDLVQKQKEFIIKMLNEQIPHKNLIAEIVRRYQAKIVDKTTTMYDNEIRMLLSECAGQRLTLEEVLEYLSVHSKAGHRIDKKASARNFGYSLDQLRLDLTKFGIFDDCQQVEAMFLIPKGEVK